MVGVPGAGKTAFATQFARTFNSPFVDYAELRQLADNDELAYRFADHLIDQLLRTQQTILIDGPGDKLADRKEIVKIAKKHGYAPLFIWVQTEPTAAEYRAVHAKDATMTKDDFDARTAEFEFLTKGEPVLVISGKHTYPSQAKIVLKKLITERPSVVDSKIETPPPRVFPNRGRIVR